MAWKVKELEASEKKVKELEEKVKELEAKVKEEKVKELEAKVKKTTKSCSSREWQRARMLDDIARRTLFDDLYQRSDDAPASVSQYVSKQVSKEASK